MRAWLQVAIVVLALGLALMPPRPEIVERWYATGIYPFVQRILTPLTNRVPIALFDVLTFAAGIAVVVTLVRAIRRARREKRWSPLAHALAHLVTAAAILYIAFLGLWGLNYRRVAMPDRLAVRSDTPSTEAVVALGMEAVARLNMFHAEAHARGWNQAPWDDERLRESFAQVQHDLAEGTAAVPGRLKRSIYGPYFRWTSVDGMVNPFGLEIIANPDLLPFERPFVAAHEWAHLAGFADESEANFVGWLTCIRSSVPAEYSGWLYLYWQVSGELRARDRTRLSAALAPGPSGDVEAIVERIRRGQLPLLRNASWRIYDQYLRANRVEEGVASYGQVVTLILRARFEDGWRPVRRDHLASH